MLSIEERQVQLHDPLCLNDKLLELPYLIETGNFENSIVTTIRNLASIDLSAISAKACVRDIGFIMSIFQYKRPHDSFNNEYPEAVKLLMKCSTKSEELPVDTVYSYTIRNPFMRKEIRSFTKTFEEQIFISCVADSIWIIDNCIDVVFNFIVNKDEEKLEDVFETLFVSIQAVTNNLKKVIQNVSPIFFSERMRPFFNHKTIKGKSYAGAGGAQMNLLFLDYMIWGKNIIDKNQIYSNYFRDNIRYLPKCYMNGYSSLPMSLITYVKEAGNFRAKKYIQDYFKLISSFRRIHLGLANMNMKVRPQNSLGSGGYSTKILEDILNFINKEI